jgi:hypothetical protein
MNSMFKDPNMIKLVCAVVFVALLVWYVYPKLSAYERFTDESNGIVADNRSVELIQPPHFDATTRTIMSGSGFSLPDEMFPAWDDSASKFGSVDGLDDGAGNSYGLMTNLCSKSCCGDQYPTPFDVSTDKEICAHKDEFVPNNLTCNNAFQDSGCLCMTKNQANFISSRGGNA